MAPIQTQNRRGVLRGGGGTEKVATHPKRPIAHTGLEREKGGGHGVLPAGGTLYTDPSSPSALPPASSSAWSPYAMALDGRKMGWGPSGTGKGNPVRRGGKETRQRSPYRTASRGSGGRGAGSGRRSSPTSRVAFPPSRKGVHGSGARGEEEDGAVSLPTLLVSRRSYQKALQVAAAAGGGSDRKNGGATKKRMGGSRQGSAHSAGSRGAPPAASAPPSKELEVYSDGRDTLPTFPPGYVLELEERVRLLDRHLGEARLALQDALVTVERLRRENDTLRALQQQIAQKGGDALGAQGAALPTPEMAGQESSSSSSSGEASHERGERTRSLLPPSMDLARLTAENSLLEEQKRLLGEEVRRLQAAQQESWETSQQQLSTLTTQLHQFHHSASTNADALHTAEAKWGQEKAQLERECHALKIRLTHTEAELTACRAGGTLSSSSHAITPSSIPLPGCSAADKGLDLLAGSSPSVPPLPMGGSSSSSSSPSSGSGGGGGEGLDVAVLQEMRRHQAEETKSILQHERTRWEEERNTLRRELSDAQRALLQGTQEKYSLRFYTDRVQQLEGELSQKSSEVGQMEQQLLHALGALQSCQRDATEAVRQEVGQELAQLRQDVEDAHAARREKEKQMMEQREQLAEANRKAQQWGADVAMYKEMIEKYYAGVLDGLSGPLHGAAAQGGGQAPTSPLHSTHRGSGSRSGRLPSGGRMPTQEKDGQPHHLHPSPVSALPPFAHPNAKTPSGLSSEELHRAYAVAALQKSSAKYTSLWSDAAHLSPSLRMGSDGKPLALSAEAKAPLQLFEALQWDEKWEAKQLREALATAALDVELAVQQSQQERTQAEHYREQLANMTKERDVLLDENIEMRRRLRHVQTVFAKQQMHAYRSSLTQRRAGGGGGGGSVVSVGMAYAEGEQRNEYGGGGNGPLPTDVHGSQGEGKAWTTSSAAMAASHGQVDILLRSVCLDDAVLPLLQLLASPPQRHHPTSLFFTLDGLLGYGTMLSPTFYSVEEGLSDVLFQYGGLSPDTLTVDEIQRTTLVLQLHHALRGGTTQKGDGSHKKKKGNLKGVGGKRTPLLEEKTSNTNNNTNERTQRADEANESEEEDDDDPITMTMMEEGGIEGGSEIIAQAELPGAWLLQASEMAQEATLDLISGRGDVVGHVMMEFSCHQLMLPITLGLPLTRDGASHDGEDGKWKCGVDNGMVLSASEVKAALVALRSVIAIRIQVFRLDGITAWAKAKTSGGGGEGEQGDAVTSSSFEQRKEAEGQEKEALPGGPGGGMREVSPYVFYTTNSVLPSVSAIRDTVVRPIAVHRHNAEEAKGDASTSGPLLSASFESTPTEHRVAVDRDLIHFLCYSSVAFVVFDEHEADVSQQLGMAEIPLRSLLDSPQAFIREETVLHPRGKLTVGLSWRSL